MSNPCPHNNFKANVNVNRIENETRKVADFIADVTIYCSDCDLPFQFRGIPHGFNGNQPTTDIANLEARLPIVPADGALRMPSKMPGFSAQKTEF